MLLPQDPLVEVTVGDNFNPPDQNKNKKKSLNQKGAALLITLVAITLLIFLAVEISYDTTVEYQISNSEVQSVKAYYAAKSGIELSLFRLYLYKQAVAQFKAQLGNNANLLDMIWQFPFAWPPSIPGEVSKADKDLINKSLKESIFDAAYVASIESEGAKIDLNDLISKSAPLSKGVKQQLMKLLQDRLDKDDAWAKNNRDMKVEEIINNIIDYMDEDSEGKNGGGESGYSELQAQSGVKDLPPNRPLKTLEELHMVAGMTDEIYDILMPHVTVYGVKGINVNLVSKEIIRSIDSQIDDTLADDIIKRRNDVNAGGPFKDEQDFIGFLGNRINPNKFNENKIPLLFESENNFRIKSTGIAGNINRQILAITYDFETIKKRMKALMVDPSQAPSPGPSEPPLSPGAAPSPSPQPSGAAADNSSSSSGKPEIVYWYEN